MSTNYREDVDVVADENYESKRRVVERTPSQQNVLMRRLNQIIWLFTTAIVLFIVLRFVFKLMAVNAANAFASFVYSISDIFMAPFVTLVEARPAGDGIFEVSAFIAVAVYVFGALILTTLVRILLKDTGGYRRVTTYERER